MTQLSMAVLSLQNQSKFAKAYSNGVSKNLYWETYLEDCLDLISKLPELAARIYNKQYRNNAPTKCNPSLDWAGNYAAMMGFDNFEI
jgi:citrate synthase